MKVLWITNILFPEAANLLFGNRDLKSSGGWMLGAAEALLSESTDVNLYIATVSNSTKDLVELKGERVTYYVLPLNGGNVHYNNSYEAFFKIIKNKLEPDIIHIHGSEFSQGLSWVKACGPNRVIVSIQGLPTVYQNYYYSGLSIAQIMYINIYGLLYFSKINGKRQYAIQSLNEVQLLSKVNNVIGRTEWDKSHVWNINPNARYYFCNETLRPEFYDGKWCYTNCQPHSIFLSQANKPIKGFHQLLKALSIVVREYPDTKLYIAGVDIYSYKLKLTAFKDRYGSLSKKLIRRYGLRNNIEFVGPQNAQGIKDLLLRSNIFVSPSSIENSPNSLGEAQMLGVPCISSFVGGVADMIPSHSCGTMYRYSEYSMLAFEICRIFKEADGFDNTAMCEIARKRHDPVLNAKQTINIYKDIMK